MTTELRQVSPLRDVSLASLNRLVVEVNKQLDSASLAIGQVQDTSTEVNTVVDQTQGVASGVVKAVPDAYDPAYFAEIITTVLDRLNTLIEALQARGIVGKKAD